MEDEEYEWVISTRVSMWFTLTRTERSSRMHGNPTGGGGDDPRKPHSHDQFGAHARDSTKLTPAAREARKQAKK